MRLACLFVLSLLPAFVAAETRYPVFLPDVDALHKRLPPHPHVTHSFASSPTVIIRLEPDYPDTAVRNCYRGWVFLEFTIREDGRVDDVVVLAQDHRRIFG